MEPAATVARSFLLLNCQLPEVLSCARADIRLELHCYPAQRRALAITPQFYIEEYDRVGLQAGGSVCVWGGGGGVEARWARRAARRAASRQLLPHSLDRSGA